jgi:hypothetical protein
MAKSIAEKLRAKDDGHCNLEAPKENWKYTWVKDTQIEQIGASGNILDLKKSATR